MSEEEIMQLKLPDRIGFNLDILFVSGHSYPKDTSLMWTPLQYGHLSNVDTSNVDTSLMWTPLMWTPLECGHLSNVDTSNMDTPLM